MRKTLVAVALGLPLLLTATPADAECNALCRTRCENTFHLEFSTKEECFRVWAVRNKNPEAARALMNYHRSLRGEEPLPPTRLTAKKGRKT